MRERLVAFSFILYLSITLLFCSPVFASRSRLSGMGDLSIVIEDESNMINLWDFAGNPAAFPDDEKGSSLKGDFIWNVYDIEALPYYGARGYLRARLDASGNAFDNLTFVSFRKDGEYGVGLKGNYFFWDTDSDYDDLRTRYPGLGAVFSRRVGSGISLGTSLEYIDYDYDFNRLDYPFRNEDVLWSQETLQGFEAKLGLSRRLTSGSAFGLTFGYQRMKISWVYATGGYSEDAYEPYPNYALPYVRAVSEGISKVGWLSGQAVIHVQKELSFGTECMLQFLDSEVNYHEPNNRVYLKFRGVYDASSRVRLGVLFSGANSYMEYTDPVYSYFSSILHKTSTTEWGAGLAFRFHRDLLAAVEYHGTKQHQPARRNEPWDLKSRSLNFGIEGRVAEEILLRGGYIGLRTDRELYSLESGKMGQDVATFGCGFQPSDIDLTLELSVQYAFNTYKDWYGSWNTESNTRRLSLSLKRAF